MVRYGYYAHMAANLLIDHPALQMLKADGYDVADVMREASAWHYGAGREIAKALDRAVRSAAEDELTDFGRTDAGT